MTPKTASQPLTEALQRQFAKAHATLRDAIRNCPESAWKAPSDHPFFIPARLAFHIIQATDYHLDPNPGGFNWSRFGFDWEEAAPDALPDLPAVLAYLEETEAKTNRRLLELSDAGLLGPDYSPYFPTALDHVLYTLRHTQHHTGQINAELKRRGHKPASWR